MGFLSIKSSNPILNTVTLDVPNYVIKELYFDFFGSLIREASDFKLDLGPLKEAIGQLAIHAKADLFIDIINKTLEGLSRRDFIKFDEKDIKLLMITYLSMSRIYYVRSEVEVSGGFIDVLLQRRVGIPVPFEAIFEIKYLKQCDASEQNIQQKLDEGKSQLERYIPDFMDPKTLKKWVFVFAGASCVRILEVDSSY
jgi:hypothetical protein